MVRHSAIVFGRWASGRPSLPRDRPGRIPTSSVSSVRSAGNVWITLSSSTTVTCAASCRAIFNIIMKSERIFRLTRIAHGLVLYSYPPQAITLSPSRRSAACTIAMSVAPREMGEAAPSYLFPPNCPQFIFEQGQRKASVVRGETQTPRVSDPFFFDAFDGARTGRPATRDESRAIGRRLYDGVIATGKAEEVDALAEGYILYR